MSEITGLRRYYWSVRRELWENPAIWIVPLAAGALALVGFLVSGIRLASQLHSPAADSVQKMLLARPYDIAEILIMMSAYVVAIIYCVDTLYAERRDRSILFWKSLPVSDRTTVLAKASIPLLVIPVVTTAATMLTFAVTNLSGSLISAIAGVPVGTHPHLPRAAVNLFYHLITFHALGWAPFFAWLLLVSAWARRAPLVWALAPFIGSSMVERIAFHTSYFLDALKAAGGFMSQPGTVPGATSTDPMTSMAPDTFFITPGLWIGLVVAGVFLFLAVRLRRAHGAA